MKQSLAISNDMLHKSHVLCPEKMAHYKQSSSFLISILFGEEIVMDSQVTFQQLAHIHCMNLFVL